MSRIVPATAKLLRLPFLAIACLLVIKLDMTSLKNVSYLQSNLRRASSSVLKAMDDATEETGSVWNNTTTTMLSKKLASLLWETVGMETGNYGRFWNGAPKDDEHYTQKDIVHLMQWEEESLQGLLHPNVTQRSSHKTCRVPPGVKPACCLGTFSTGGGTQGLHRHRCAEPMRHLDAVRRNALRFFRENPIDRGDVACDVCRIVDLARRHNLTIALMGDSMHNQIHDGLSCELERRNYNVTHTDIDKNPSNDPTWIFRRHTRSEILHVRSSTWAPEEVVTIVFHRIYLLPLVNNDDALALTAQADVLVLGFGLHYWWDNDTPHVFRRMDSYVEAMKDIFVNVTEQGHVKLLVHRETSAQHFDANGGEFIEWYAQRDKLRHSCQPMRYSDTSVYWREKAIQRAVSKADHDLVVAGPNMMPPSTHGRPEVVVLPYFNFTSQHYDMHPRQDNSFDDCTHYCSSPYVYYPLWRSLRFAMDRQFATR